MVAVHHARWSWLGLRRLRVTTIGPGGTLRLDTGADEMLVLPLTGSATVDCDGQRFELVGRSSVFDGVSDFCYLPRDSHVAVSSTAGGRFALPSAAAGRRLPARRVAAGDVPSNCAAPECAADRSTRSPRPTVSPATGCSWSRSSHRGATGRATHPISTTRTTPTSAGWRRSTTSRSAGDGMGYQRVYASTPLRPIDVLAEVRTGDAVLVPLWLARAVHRRAGLRSVLPQRDGRTRPRTELAILRRPGACLGPRVLDRPAGGPAAPTGDRRGTSWVGD